MKCTHYNEMKGMVTNMVHKIEQNNMQDALKAKVAVVDFSATWCGPCRMQGPVVEQLSEELDGKVSFFKVDVDENQATAEKFGVMSIPTMIIQKDGKVVDTVIGYHEKDALKKIIEKYL